MVTISLNESDCCVDDNTLEVQKSNENQELASNISISNAADKNSDSSYQLSDNILINENGYKISDGSVDNDNEDNDDDDDDDDDNGDEDNVETSNKKEELTIETVYKTIEEYNNDSRVLTHESLVNLGKTLAEAEINEQIKENELHKIIVYFNNIKNNSDKKVGTMIREKSKLEILQIIEMANKYIKLCDTKVSLLLSENNKLKEDNKEMCEETKELISENDKLEEKNMTNKTYYEKRILNLRNKCLHKNRVKKFLLFMICASNFLNSLNSFYIMKYGFKEYIDRCTFIALNFVNFIYFIVYFIHLFINSFYEHAYHITLYFLHNTLHFYTVSSGYLSIMTETIIFKYNDGFNLSDYYSNISFMCE